MTGPSEYLFFFFRSVRSIPSFRPPRPSVEKFSRLKLPTQAGDELTWCRGPTRRRNTNATFVFLNKTARTGTRDGEVPKARQFRKAEKLDADFCALQFWCRGRVVVQFLVKTDVNCYLNLRVQFFTLRLDCSLTKSITLL